MPETLRPAATLLLLLLCGAGLRAQTLDARSPGPTAPPTTDEGPVVTDIQQIDPETFHAIAVRLPEGRAPKIDGHLDDDVWALAPVQGRFIQREPRFGWASTERTEFRILYDDRTLYFGIWAFDDEPGKIRASEMKRDSQLKKGDAIKITIDTFHDHRNAFYFSTNPLGARKDANTVEEGRTINYDWNAVWESRTSVDARGWYAEIAIPLSQLRFAGGPGETVWGLNLCRIIVRKNEETYWVPYPREWQSIGFARMSHAGVLLGLRDLMPRRKLELLPFAAPRVRRDYDAGTPTTAEAGYGFDVKMGLTPSLNADLTYKTDFAQVEADQEVVNLSRFSLYFPEKRRFFTESAGIFDYGGNGGSDASNPGLLPLFYSRRIGLYDGHEVPIAGGGRVTGRAGAYTIGMMNIETGATALRQGGADLALARANYTVLRVKRDVLAKSSIGGIFLNRQGGAGPAFNRTAGVDGVFSLGSHFNLTGLLAHTSTPGASGRGWAGVLDAGWKNDRFDSGVTYVDIGERFDAEMGFIPRTDIRNPEVRAAWTPRPRWRGVRQLTIGGSATYFESHAGRVASRNQEAAFAASLQDSSAIQIALARDFDELPFDWAVGRGTIPAGGYDWNTFTASYASNQSRRVYGSIETDFGGYYGGDKQTVTGSLNFLPRETLLVETSYTRNRITLPTQPAYSTNVLSTRVSYSFSPDLFVKSFVQYNDVSRLASLNLLFWYIYRPGSDLYVVYDTGWETAVPGPHALRVRGRSLAVKLTWWVAR